MKTPLRYVIVVWLAAATILSLFANLGRHPFLVPSTVLATIAVGVAWYRRSPAMRASIDALDVRALLAVHLMRAPVGAMFLVMHSRGALPAIFALRAGVGDLLVGLSAIAIVVAHERRRAVLAWNALGMVDIVMSVATAQKVLLFDRDPRALATVQTFPFPLIPFFLVPLVVLTHLALFARLRARESRAIA